MATVDSSIVNVQVQEALKRLWEAVEMPIWGYYYAPYRGFRALNGEIYMFVQTERMRRVYEHGNSPWIHINDEHGSYILISADQAKAMLSMTYEEGHWALA